MSCLELVANISNAIKETNSELVSNILEKNVSYIDCCVHPSITFDYYYKQLSSKIEKIVGVISDGNSNITNMMILHELYKKSNSAKIPKNDLVDMIKQLDQDTVINNVYDSVQHLPKKHKFNMSPDMIEFMINLSHMIRENCGSDLPKIFEKIAMMYSTRLKREFDNMGKEEVVHWIKYKYQIFNRLFDQTKPNQNNLLGGASIQIPIEEELNRLIPDQIGSMKSFFIKIIVCYYNTLHPIVWSQIIRGMIDNIEHDLPLNQDELFSYISKHLLLNSGPFVLKILQMIRPVLTDEMALKYNLTRLSYPLLEMDDVEKILRMSMIDYDNHILLYNKSASLGHVTIIRDIRNNGPDGKFVVKIIKPLSIVQSCWEYSTLSDLFNDGCDKRFVLNMLESNGKEMNVFNEIKNLVQGYEQYTATYSQLFGYDVDAKLTTVRHLENRIVSGRWFCLAMSLAPGIPLTDLIETNQLKKDTAYRANLHRCLDCLVERFFFNLVKNGFYHGDLHAGNIFYSYEEKQITLIDFGAVGRLDMFSGDTQMIKLLEIIIMSVYYNYDEMFDNMTNLLNELCEDDILINMNDKKYQEQKEKFLIYRLKNILNQNDANKNQKQFIDDIFNKKRRDDEKRTYRIKTQNKKELKDDESIYEKMKSMRIELNKKEVVVENRDDLPVFTEVIDNRESVTFSKVMAEMIQFYAENGVNVAVKFAEFYELQKAYSLLLGVLYKVDYSSYRLNDALRRGIASWAHWTKIFKITTFRKLITCYWKENTKHKKAEKIIENIKFNQSTNSFR